VFGIVVCSERITRIRRHGQEFQDRQPRRSRRFLKCFGLLWTSLECGNMLPLSHWDFILKCDSAFQLTIKHQQTILK